MKIVSVLVEIAEDDTPTEYRCLICGLHFVNYGTTAHITSGKFILFFYLFFVI